MDNEIVNKGTNWNNAFRAWEDLSESEQLACLISDKYKEVYGMRPRNVNFNELSVEDLRTWYEELSNMCKEQLANDRGEELVHSQAVQKAMTRT